MVHWHLPDNEASKQQKYEALIPAIRSLTESEPDLIANLANVTAVLKEQFHWFWIGFYLVRQNELVLGPFQGTLACTRIAYGKGVCGKAWEWKRTVIVPDVEQFEGHIACSSLSRSEIVIPVFHDSHCVAVLDIDHTDLNAFDEVDAHYLEQLVRQIPINPVYA